MLKLLGNTRRHDITFHRNGLIRITAQVARILGIQPGDSIDIAVTPTNEYLLFAVPHNFGRHQAKCYPTKRGSRNLCAHSALLCSRVFNTLGLDVDKVSFMTGEPVDRFDALYLPIITRNPLCSKK